MSQEIVEVRKHEPSDTLMPNFVPLVVNEKFDRLPLEETQVCGHGKSFDNILAIFWMVEHITEADVLDVDLNYFSLISNLICFATFEIIFCCLNINALLELFHIKPNGFRSQNVILIEVLFL